MYSTGHLYACHVCVSRRRIAREKDRAEKNHGYTRKRDDFQYHNTLSNISVYSQICASSMRIAISEFILHLNAHRRRAIRCGLFDLKTLVENKVEDENEERE